VCILYISTNIAIFDEIESDQMH